ncbi:isoflavone reductase [Colletotrichum phormii]|uniref:Isoflavone reductase n=1 Tax=Colletotrichum phormii TaxID=359342 RepID=A0AAJ0E8C1_9PEZI|nr:isoflavone reductase [Colletotrichum phormii]KAK1622679.1 isoflavone reductase [Colletotrichum phormii]
MKVAVLGGTGVTGTSIMNGLLSSPETKYEITALIRPSSLEKPEVKALEKRGVKIASVDLSGPEDEIANQLTGHEVVVSAIVADKLLGQIPLANAAKKAGVKRFVPCFFGTVMPGRGMLWFRDQVSLPRLPSGRIDAVASPFDNWIAGDGTVRSGMTDLRDIGKYVARIIADSQTLNHRVFAFTELLSQNEVYDLIKKMSGEKVERKYMSGDEIEAEMVKAKDDKANPHRLSVLQYRKSWGLRGDNTPEYARYLGYQIAKDLYPDLTGNSFEAFCSEVLEGKANSIYEKKKREAMEAAGKKRCIKELRTW